MGDNECHPAPEDGWKGRTRVATPAKGRNRITTLLHSYREKATLGEGWPPHLTPWLGPESLYDLGFCPSTI